MTTDLALRLYHVGLYVRFSDMIHFSDCLACWPSKHNQNIYVKRDKRFIRRLRNLLLRKGKTLVDKQVIVTCGKCRPHTYL